MGKTQQGIGYTMRVESTPKSFQKEDTIISNINVISF